MTCFLITMKLKISRHSNQFYGYRSGRENIGQPLTVVEEEARRTQTFPG